VLGAESVIGPIIKLVVTVAILAAVGIFIVKPILDTTEDISRQVNESVRNGLDQSNQASQDVSLNIARSRANGYAQSLQSAWPAASREVKRCIAEADSLAAMNRCADFAQRLVFTVQSDRTFALSNAQSLVAQGDTAGAQRIRECVHDAGFEVAAMNRCRQLANDLIFG
jgi:hypothetical protein